MSPQMTTEHPEPTALSWVPPHGIQVGASDGPTRSIGGPSLGSPAAVTDQGYVFLTARALTAAGREVDVLPERSVIRAGDLLPSVAGRAAGMATAVVGEGRAVGADRSLDVGSCASWMDVARTSIDFLAPDLGPAALDDLLDAALRDPLSGGLRRVLPPDGAELDPVVHPVSELRAGLVLGAVGWSEAAIERVVTAASDLSGSEPLVVLTAVTALGMGGAAEASLTDLESRLPGRTRVISIVEVPAKAGDPAGVIDRLAKFRRATGVDLAVLSSDVAVIEASAHAGLASIAAGVAGAPLTPNGAEAERLLRLDASLVHAILAPTWVLDRPEPRVLPAPGSIGERVAELSDAWADRAIGAMTGTLPRPEVVDVIGDLVFLASPEGDHAVPGLTGTASLLWCDTGPARPAGVEGVTVPLPARARAANPSDTPLSKIPAPDRRAAASAVCDGRMRPWVGGPALTIEPATVSTTAREWVRAVEKHIECTRAAHPAESGRQGCVEALTAMGEKVDPGAPRFLTSSVTVLLGENRAAVCDPVTGATAVLTRPAGAALVAYLDARAADPDAVPPSGPALGALWTLLNALEARGIALAPIPRPAPEPDPALLSLVGDDAEALELYREEGAGIWDALPLGGLPDEQRWVDHAGRLAGPRSRVLELLAGSARIGLALAQAGHQVTAVDRQQAMVSQAQRRRHESDPEVAARLTAVCEDATSLQLDGHFDAVIIGETSISLLSPDQLRDVFQVAARHLRPGGFLMFDYVSGDVPPHDLAGRVEPVPSRTGAGRLLASERPEAASDGIPTTAATWVWQRADGRTFITTDRHRRWTRRVLTDSLNAAGFGSADLSSPADGETDPRPVRLCIAAAPGSEHQRPLTTGRNETRRHEHAGTDVEVPA